MAQNLTMSALAGQYAAELRRLGRTPKYVAQVLVILAALARAAGVWRVRSWTPPLIERALASVAARSATTQNYYRGALGSLLRWALRTRRTDGHNPIEGVSPVRRCRGRRRRAMSFAELAAFRRLAPERRALAYEIALSTGLRRSEIAGLTVGNVCLDASGIMLPHELAKNREDAFIPVPRGLLDMLRARCDGAAPDEKLVVTVPTVRTFYRDLAAAGIARATAEGLLDFHALRTTFATILARLRVPLTLTQRLCRHSTPELTANIYTRYGLDDDLRHAVSLLDLPIPAEGLGAPCATRTRDPLIKSGLDRPRALARGAV